MILNQVYYVIALQTVTISKVFSWMSHPVKIHVQFEFQSHPDYFSILRKSWHKCPFKEIQIWLLSLKRRRGKKNRSSEVKFTVSQKNNWEIKNVLCMWMLKPSVNEGLGFYHILRAKWCNKVYERNNQSSTTIILL